LSALANAIAPVVREAGDLAHAAFGKPFKTWVKENNSPVSEVDIAVDVLLKERLTAIAPDAGWLSEETEDNPARLAASRVWIVDPIDGTRAFVAGRPDWAISVALVEAGRPVVAALYAPARPGTEHRLRQPRAARSKVPGSGVPGDFSTVSPWSRQPSRFLPGFTRRHYGSPALRMVHSMRPLRVAQAATGILRLPTFWCTKPEGC